MFPIPKSPPLSAFVQNAIQLCLPVFTAPERDRPRTLFCVLFGLPFDNPCPVSDSNRLSPSNMTVALPHGDLTGLCPQQDSNLRLAD